MIFTHSGDFLSDSHCLHLKVVVRLTGGLTMGTHQNRCRLLKIIGGSTESHSLTFCLQQPSLVIKTFKLGFCFIQEKFLSHGRVVGEPWKTTQFLNHGLIFCLLVRLAKGTSIASLIALL